LPANRGEGLILSEIDNDSLGEAGILPGPDLQGQRGLRSRNSLPPVQFAAKPMKQSWESYVKFLDPDSNEFVLA
jgi:hypothetical protein